MSILSNWMSSLPVPDVSHVYPTTGAPHFPRVTGINLERASLELPGDFGGELNLLLFAFQQWQQPLIDRWIPLAMALEARYPALRYYEIPTLDSFSAPQRLWINEGMRAGIPDPVARERTVSIYLHDKPAFMRALGLGSDLMIYALLVTRSGDVIWSVSGDLDNEKQAALQREVERFLQHDVHTRAVHS